MEIKRDAGGKLVPNDTDLSEPRFPSRDEKNQPICPECGNVLQQVERADFCGCGYKVVY